MQPNRRFYLLTHPRTASNLLVKVLGLEGQQPDVEFREEGSGYFFIHSVTARWAVDLGSKRLDDWTEEEKTQTKERYQHDFDKFEAFLQKAESNKKIAFIKEHAHFLGNPALQWPRLHGDSSASNPAEFRVKVPGRYAEHPTWSDPNITILPDEFLRTFMPIILIRHPAMMFPSMARAGSDLAAKLDMSMESESELVMSMKDIRGAYEFYANDLAKRANTANGPGPWPVIVDADDLIANTGAIATKLCELTGLSKSHLQFAWDKDTRRRYEENDPLQISAERMLSTLRASNGVLKDKMAGNIDLDVEAKKWKEEFGEEKGENLEKHVRAAMPDYEFLKARRLQV